jgi:hypothetical protein
MEYPLNENYLYRISRNQSDQQTKDTSAANMSLLILPVELIHHVLNYCDVQTTLYSVRGVCKRLNEIVNSYNRLDLIFNSKSSYSMKPISRLVQPSNVASLVLGNDYQTKDTIKLFCSLFDMDRFTGLRSLTLYQIKNDDLEYILEHMNMTNIISLSIQSFERGYESVWRHSLWLSGTSYEREHERTWALVSSALVRCNLRKLSMSDINYKMKYITWPEQYQLEHLAINDCTYDGYLAILHQLPNLRTLVMRQCTFNDFEDKLLPSSTPLCHSSLTSLIITDYSVSLTNLEHFVLPIPSLKHLKLISHRKTIDYVFNGSIWRELIQTKLPLLDRFDFFFSYTYFEHQDCASLESIMAPFRAPFYLDDKRWFVTCAYVLTLRTIWLYTKPICSTNYGSPLRCEVSPTDNIYRLTQRPIDERSDTIADEVSSFTDTLWVKSLVPLFCFESCIKTAQHYFNSIICLDSR